MVIDDNLNDRDVVSGCGCNLIHVHTETSVSGDIQYHFIRSAHFGSDCSSDTITHGAKSAG